MKINVTVTEGGRLPDEGPGTPVVYFTADGENPVVVNIKDKNGAEGIWLNAFELKQAR